MSAIRLPARAPPTTAEAAPSSKPADPAKSTPASAPPAAAVTAPPTTAHRDEDGEASAPTAPAPAAPPPASNVLKNQHHEEEQENRCPGRESSCATPRRARHLSPHIRRDGRIEDKAELRREALGDPRRDEGQAGAVVALRKERSRLPAYCPRHGVGDEPFRAPS